MAVATSLAPGLRANPNGLTVASGSASAVTSGSHLNVTASSGAVLNWQSFNINSGETTIFQQPSAASIVFNKISDQNPSQIWGNLQANGIVVLENKSGFYFGPNAVVRAPGFIASTAAVTPQDFGGGAFWQFSGPPPQASIINYGQINAGKSGSVFLIANNIENHGGITAPGGNIGLVAGQQVLLSERPDGRGLSAQVTLPSGSVDNSGRIIADAGTIALRAQVVNQNGIIQADSVREQNGVIELVASDSIVLGDNSVIQARGDTTTASAGGQIEIKSGQSFTDTGSSQISVAGGELGGSGGAVEISAPLLSSINSQIDGHASAGDAGGRLIIDPTDIVLGSSGTGSAGSGTVTAGSSTGTLNLNVNSTFKGFSQIDLQATHNISLAPGLNWNLSTSTGLGAGQFTLQAGNNIIFGNTSSPANPTIYDTGNWSVNLTAGVVDFTTGNVQSGVGSIYLNGGMGQNLSGAIQTAQGSISLTAGQDILVGSGYVNTSQGGSIVADALAGSINAGTVKGGFALDSTGYHVPNGTPVGGISTVKGGNVTLEAGQNVISTPAVPTAPVNQTPGASGAYGSQPGDVTVIAGNQILGSFLVRNGTGLLEAGVTVQDGKVTQVLNPTADIGSAAAPVTLSLISGNWETWAADDAFIGEVRNPNGIFNANKVPVASSSEIYPGNIDASGNVTAPPIKQAFLFDYAPDAGASVWAGDGITLGSSSLVRVSGGVPASQAIYPPRLSLEAGAGGITIANPNVVLFPSPLGSLNIVTHDGGDLDGTFLPNGRGLTGIIMSDSGLPDFQTFGGNASTTGHATTPLHLADPNLVELNISGGIDTFLLTVPTAASISAQSIHNFNFTGQNLTPSAVTTINVAGDISYRGDLTSVTLSDVLPAGVFDPSLSTDPNTTRSVIYNPATGTLSFIGQMNATQEASLLNPSVFVFDAFGQPVLDANGAQVTVPVALSLGQKAAIQQLYTDSQTASLADAGGFNLNGPGRLSITAQNMDLGISGGIRVNSENPFLPALTAVTPLGASLDINLLGNLEMSSTEIMNGGLLGGIQVKVGGKVDAGTQAGVFGDPNQARGIFTTSGGNVSVTATGDVNVDGSRIAAYDGGNVNVTSTQGDVNAGSGGNGAVNLDAVLQLDANGHLEIFNSITAADGTVIKGIPMFGSGILATTIGQSSARVGDITVTAPNGSINANVGGIEQIAFNHNTGPDSFIELDAGENIAAGNSGVIGSNIRAHADGSISGVFVGSGNVNINATGNFAGTVVGSTVVAINAGGTVSGTIVGGDSISVSGTSITASLISGSVSTTGDIGGANVGVPASNVQKEDSKIADDASTTVAKADDQTTDDDDLKKKRGGQPLLAKSTGRVTVISPKLQ